jgi:hypothetical protein
MTTPSWADSPIHEQIRAAGLDPISERAALGPSDVTDCSACGQKPRRKVDYGDFTEYEVRCLVAEYCMSVTLGCTGWGVDFKTWVELRGIAKHGGMFRLIRLPNVEHIRPEPTSQDNEQQ